MVGCLIPIVISAYHGAHAVPRRCCGRRGALGTRPRAALVPGRSCPRRCRRSSSGLRLAIAISIFTLLASELLIRGSGVGAYMFTALDNGQTLTVFAVSAIVAALGFLVDAPTSPPSAARRRGWRGRSDACAAVYPFALLVALWWVLAARGVLGNEFVMPPPGPRARSHGDADEGTLAARRSSRCAGSLTAYALALPSASRSGTLIGCVRPVRLALRPLVSFLFPAPKVALYPAMLIVFGLGSASKVVFGFGGGVPGPARGRGGTSQVEPRLAVIGVFLGEMIAGPRTGSGA